MEHRWGHRVAADIDVRLFGCPASIGWGRLRDVSVSGGFIETRLSLPLLSIVRLTLPSKGRGTTESRPVQAVVIRRVPGGVGVEWFDSAGDAIEPLIRAASEDARMGHASQAQAARPSHY